VLAYSAAIDGVRKSGGGIRWAPADAGSVASKATAAALPNVERVVIGLRRVWVR
jgi:hypothetical protein